ncbi:DUF6107 family protein [Salaquimonas pukyongi]|uniref:DUF6107 family protein n=1 Tax=Salaquimonas pukyongi TaxID=2712698 RepID=UPI001FCDB322|nr:DUF6107 family protein [Salaquimonas pukyongi]
MADWMTMPRFDVSLSWLPAELPEQILLWMAKATGAVLGSAISIAYVLPRGRREAAVRFLTGVSVGIVFGPVVSTSLVRRLGLEDGLSRFEVALMGAAGASLAAWWALGALQRFFDTRFVRRGK